ncbi:MAG: lysophospholipase [Chloroflexota bacterium]|nr:lysophospholipase [Chloroflexota bacterium]
MTALSTADPVSRIRHIRDVIRPEPEIALAVAAWIPDAPKAVAYCCHGHAEHLGRYSHLITALTARGYAVYGQDHRGHGRSSGTRALAMRFDDFVDDFRLLTERAHQEHPDLPQVLIGHSMGGLIAVRYALRYGDDLAALVTSGPALVIDEGVASSHRLVGTVLARLVPAGPLPRGRDDEDFLTTDPEVRRQFGMDPLTHHGATRLGTAAAMLRAGEDARRKLDRIRLPLLAMHGANDTLTFPSGTRALYERASSADKTLKLWPGMKHEIFNEPDRREVVTSTLDWIDTRIGDDDATSD